MEITNYTEEQEILLAHLWSITPDQFRALPENEKLHYWLYGTEMGQCAMSEMGRDVALATQEERRAEYLDRMFELNKPALIHILLWGAEPCPQVPDHP